MKTLVITVSSVLLLISPSAFAEPTGGAARDGYEPVNRGEVTTSDGPSNWDKIDRAYENHRDAGGFIEDNGEPEITDHERQEMEQQAYDAEHPFGKPEDARGGDGPPLPDKVDHSDPDLDHASDHNEGGYETGVDE